MSLSFACCPGAAFAPTVGKPYEGELHVRFDEGVLETGCGCGLRHRRIPTRGRPTATPHGPPVPRQRPTLQLKNVLDKLPKRLHGRAKSAVNEIIKAATREEAQEALERFASDYRAKYPKAVASLTKHQEQLLTFYDFPAEHWEHVRTVNPLESTFATVRLRQRVTKGAGSRSKALLMAYKLLDMASERWRRVNAPGLVAQLLRGDEFIDGLSKEARNAA